MLNTKDVKSLMSKQERSLILNSGISDNNEKLCEVLSLFNGRIEKKDINKIKQVDEDISKLISTREAVIEMVDIASLEWAHEEHKGKVRVPCELCGSKKSEDKYIIKNQVNNKRLLVGTSCIEKFEKIDNKLYGLSLSEINKLSKQNGFSLLNLNP